MSLKKIPIEEASNQQLLDYAIVQMGLDVKKGIGTNNLLAKMREAEPDLKEIMVAEAPVVQQAQPAPLKNEALMAAPPPANDKDMQHYRYDPKVTINIMVDEYKVGGKADVPISVNGEQILVKRGVNADIPYRFYEVLTQSWESHYDPTYPNGPQGRCELVERRVLSYPFQIVGALPSAEEIAAYQERTSKISVQEVGKTPAAPFQAAA